MNPRCSEKDIVDELNIVLRDHRIKRENSKTKKEDQLKIPITNFILSAIVFYDPVTNRPKQFAFVDFSTKEAAQVCLNAWNNSSMKMYPNRLCVQMFDGQHQKMTKAERERTRDKKGPFTNLFVEKLPYAF